jgi:hypothetical protein
MRGQARRRKFHGFPKQIPQIINILCCGRYCIRDVLLSNIAASISHAALSDRYRRLFAGRAPWPRRSRRAKASDILLVALDGRLHKQNGVLTDPNEGLIQRE